MLNAVSGSHNIAFPFGAVMRALSEAPSGAAPIQATDAGPRSRARENEGEFLLALEVPGLTRESLKVTVDAGVLVLEGTLPDLLAEDEGRSFRKQLPLPKTVDPDQIKAVLQDGILTIRLPKYAKVQPRDVEIEVAQG